jgi:hypothetical protein
MDRRPGTQKLRKVLLYTGVLTDAGRPADTQAGTVHRQVHRQIHRQVHSQVRYID